MDPQEGIAVTANALAGVDKATDDAGASEVLVARLRATDPSNQVLPDTPRLRAAPPGSVWPVPAETTVGVPPAHAWTWHDECGDCTYRVDAALEIHAANARDLWGLNASAPRLLLAAPTGDFAVQCVCCTVSEAHLALGGLMLWGDHQHYLVLEWGRWGAADLAFRGCLANVDRLFGRGRLSGDRHWLRLERRGHEIRALGSVDGQAWFCVGAVSWTAQGALQVGVHAIGSIERAIHPGAHTQGTATRFEHFILWQDR
jgi:hypothetical protein